MNKRFLITTSIMLTLLTAIPSQYAFADDDHIQARQLQGTGEILSLENILKKISPKFQGKILEVEFEKKDGQMIYEIEILGKDGIVKEIYINAKTGNILYVKEDD